MSTGDWICGNCKTLQPSTAATCLKCGVKPPQGRAPVPVRDQLPSFSGLMDTKSFIVPTQKRAVWIWVSITVGLPLLMSLAYFLVTWIFH